MSDVASGLYNRGKKLITGKGWDTAQLRVLLTTLTYTPDPDHNVVTDVTNELSGGNYARRTLTPTPATEDDVNDRAAADGGDVTFPALGLAAGEPKYAVIYIEGGGTDATRELVAWVNLGTPITPDGSDVCIRWDANGIILLT